MLSVEILLWCLLVAAIIALFFGRSRRVAVLAIVVVLILLVVRAETPFGIGNGRVPDLVGLDECTATDKLADRELRWRFGPHAPIGGRPAPCIDTGGGIGSVADEIVGQRPAPGTRLPASDVVVLETDCTRERRCSRLGRYNHGVPSG
jgi:hypothetical protein